MAADVRVKLRVSTWRFTLAVRFAQATLWCFVYLPGWLRPIPVLLIAAIRRATLRLISFRVSAALVVLAILGATCACAHQRTPDLRPAPPARIEAHVVATPALTIAHRPVTLRAWLDDPDRQVRCPGSEWLYPNSTRSYHVGDCDPDVAIERHYADPRVLWLGSGEYVFRITFDASGRSWSAETTVQVQ